MARPLLTFGDNQPLKKRKQPAGAKRLKLRHTLGMSIKVLPVNPRKPQSQANVAPLRAFGRRKVLRVLGLLVTASMGGCNLRDEAFDGADAPDERPTGLAYPMAWVLSSGGPRGFTHVGVLKALDEMGCKPDLVVGSSVGALIGCLYAAGLNVASLEKLAMETNISNFIQPTLGGDEWLSVAGVGRMVNTLLQNKPLQRLSMAFAAVAIDKKSRQPRAFNWGNAGGAVQAACAMEGRTSSVSIRGRQYVDSDFVTPMPVRIARNIGAVRVLAVDVSAYEDKAPAGTERYRASDLRKRALTAPEVQLADLTLHPETSYYAGTSSEYRASCIRAGYEQTLANKTALLALHRRS